MLTYLSIINLLPLQIIKKRSQSPLLPGVCVSPGLCSSCQCCWALLWAWMMTCHDWGLIWWPKSMSIKPYLLVAGFANKIARWLKIDPRIRQIDLFPITIADFAWCLLVTKAPRPLQWLQVLIQRCTYLRRWSRALVGTWNLEWCWQCDLRLPKSVRKMPYLLVAEFANNFFDDLKSTPY